MLKLNINDEKGQSLVSLLLAIAVGAIVLVLGAQIIQVTLKTEEASRRKTAAFQLARESFEATRSIAEEDWHLIYDAIVNQEYYLDSSTGKWILSTDSQYKTITLGSDTYLRWLIFSNVSRDESGDIEAIYNASHDDPSTRKITVYISHGGIEKLSWYYYLTRWENEISSQADWSGGDGTEGPVTSFGNTYSTTTATQIDPEGLQLFRPE